MVTTVHSKTPPRNAIAIMTLNNRVQTVTIMADVDMDISMNILSNLEKDFSSLVLYAR